MDALDTFDSTTISGLPWVVSGAMERVAIAERELTRVYPLFVTKLDAHASDARSASGSQAALELQAFAAEVRLAHHAAIHALSSWNAGNASMEAVKVAYESLAVTIERFAMSAGLDAVELD